MRIGIFTDQYYPAVSGVVTSIETLEAGLRNLGHDVYIITSIDLTRLKENEIEEYNRKSKYILNIPGKHYPLKKLKGYRFCKIKNEYINDVKKLNLDIIHVQTEFSISKLAIKCSKVLNIPMIHTFHTLFDDYLSYVSGLFNKIFPNMMHNILVNRFLKPVSKQSLIEIVPTKKVYDKRNHYKLGINNDIRIIPTGINLDSFLNSQRDEMLINKYHLVGRFVYLFVGRLSEEKSIKNLIDAYKAVASDDNALLIVGDGPQANELKKYTNELKLENNIIFTGFIKWDEISKYYALGDLFLCDSKSETQGLTYLEALASGLPLLVRSDSCLNDLLKENVNGISYNNIDELISKMKFLKNNDKLLKSLKENARISTKNYTDKIFVKRILDVYEDALKINSQN